MVIHYPVAQSYSIPVIVRPPLVSTRNSCRIATAATGTESKIGSAHPNTASPSVVESSDPRDGSKLHVEKPSQVTKIDVRGRWQLGELTTVPVDHQDRNNGKLKYLE